MAGRLEMHFGICVVVEFVVEGAVVVTIDLCDGLMEDDVGLVVDAHDLALEGPFVLGDHSGLLVDVLLNDDFPGFCLVHFHQINTRIDPVQNITNTSSELSPHTDPILPILPSCNYRNYRKVPALQFPFLAEYLNQIKIMTQLPASNPPEIVFMMNQVKQDQDKKGGEEVVKSGMIESNERPDEEDKEEKVRLKSKARKIIIGLIISLSAVMFGYSIKEITSIPIDDLVRIYGITIDKFIAQSMLIGILPISAILGAVITRVLIKHFRRLSGIYVFTIVNVGAIVLVNITTFYTLMLGRSLEGVCIGFYSAIAPIYLKEIAPKQLRRMLGLFFSFGKIVGVLLAIFLELIVVQALKLTYGFRIILSLTAVFSVLQAILIFCFGSDTPTQMIEKGHHGKAKEIIQKFYHEEYVDQVMEEYTQEYEASQVDVTDEPNNQSKKKEKERTAKKTAKKPRETTNKKSYKHELDLTKGNIKSEIKAEIDSFYESEFDVKGQGDEVQDHRSDSNDTMMTDRPRLTFEEKRQKAYCLGVHLAGIRNFVGANAIITQGGIFISLFNPGLGQYTSLIVNIIQFFAVVFGMVYMQTIMGKKPLFLISIPTLSILNFALVIAMIYEQVAALLMLMCLFLIVFGVGFINPIWAYPAQVIPAAQQLPANILHWFSIAIAMLIPPLVASFMPGNNPYPVFIFFGIYTFIGFIHVRMTLRESDGLTYKQIVESFK